MPKMPTIKKNMKSSKKTSDFTGRPESEQYASYKKGAFLGGLLGAVAGLIAGERVMLYTLIGAVAGGYMSYTMYSDDFKVKGLKELAEEAK